MTPDLEFLALMYGAREEKKPSPTTGSGSNIPDRGIISLPALSQIVRTQERRLAQLTEALAQSERRVQRLENRLNTVQRHSSMVGRAVGGMERELDNKLDKRDWS